MNLDLKDFWNRCQSGVDVAVAGSLPDKLLGVRDGFARYFHERASHVVPIRVKPHPIDESSVPLPLDDLEILELARRRARELKAASELPGGFCVGSETGLLAVLLDEESRQLVRTWTVVVGLGEEAWASSGSIQLPEQVIRGLDEAQIPLAIPGTRRSGGMVSSLTGGLESRRSATALATFLAVSTLTYGLHATRRPGRGPGWRRPGR